MDVLSAVIQQSTDITLSLESDGKVLAASVNDRTRAASSLNHWIGRHIKDLLTKDSRDKIERVLRAAADRETTGALDIPPVELNHLDPSGWSLPVRYALVKVSNDGSLLMLGQDLSAIAEAQQSLVKTQQSIEDGVRNLREQNAKFQLLKEQTQDAFVYVSQETGKIAELTPSAAKLLGVSTSEALNQAFSTYFSGSSHQNDGPFSDVFNLTAFQSGSDTPYRLKDGQEVMLRATPFRSAKDRLIFFHLIPSEVASERQPQHSDTLFSQTSDAIIVTDKSGTILRFNDAFMAIIECADDEPVIGTEINDYLARGQVDSRILIDGAMQSGQVRQYMATICSRFGAEIPVSISATCLKIGEEIQFGFIIREAKADTQALGSIQDAQAASELVGQKSLKEIVAGTTDVIEKICIETAIKMTNNNRFAAAEMLNLSRQSLYVKLRKYGLLSREEK